MDKSLPTIIGGPVKKGNLFNEGKKLPKNIKMSGKQDDIIYLKDNKKDVLRGYGIGNDGNLYNELGDLVVNGHNQRHKCKEDVIRKRLRLPIIGDEEKWKKARTVKVQ